MEQKGNGDTLSSQQLYHTDQVDVSEGLIVLEYFSQQMYLKKSIENTIHNFYLKLLKRNNFNDGQLIMSISIIYILKENGIVEQSHRQLFNIISERFGFSIREINRVSKNLKIEFHNTTIKRPLDYLSIMLKKIKNSVDIYQSFSMKELSFDFSSYITKLQHQCLIIEKYISENIHSGSRAATLMSAMIYLADKKICLEYNIQPILTYSNIDETLDIPTSTLSILIKKLKLQLNDLHS
ncbi:MAG: hypothetical protein INQ03_08875 [Candidatus Heimdallarchaeota archaeon]|nr:hypothetical protein [Candidatus Heimdallarchaeota archaeon]